MKIREWVGCKAVDSFGKSYIDLTAGGIFSCMFGPAYAPIYEAMMRVTYFHCYSSRFGNYWQEKYREMLREDTGFESFVVYSGGAEAVEAALRVAWTYTGQPGVWGGLVDPDLVGTDKPPCDQFHGWTLGARILAGKIAWPELGVYPELGGLKFGLAPENTAIMAMEPYHAASGQFHKQDPTLNRIAERRKEFPNILFLIDEIQGGFGRTGKMFAHQHYEPKLYPDIVTLGKLVGAGFPMSVLCGPKEVLESESVKKFAHLHSTHSWNPLACSVGCMVIEKMRELNLIGESARKGKILHDMLSKLPVRSHGKGLMAGVEFDSPEEAAKVIRLTEERGLLVVDTGRKWVKIGPALTITDEELIKGISILKEVVEEVVNGRSGEVETLRVVGEEHCRERKDLPNIGIQGSEPGNIPCAEDAEQIRSGN